MSLIDIITSGAHCPKPDDNSFQAKLRTLFLLSARPIPIKQ